MIGLSVYGLVIMMIPVLAAEHPLHLMGNIIEP
jgi:hypothetical protein